MRRVRFRGIDDLGAWCAKRIHHGTTMNESLTLSDFDDAWDDIEPIAPGPLPDGPYRARLSAITQLEKAGEAPLLRLEFTVVDRPYQSKTVSYVVSFKRPEEVRGTLKLLGIDARPSQLPGFHDFAKLNLVRITTRLRDFKGASYPRIVSLEALPTASAKGTASA